MLRRAGRHTAERADTVAPRGQCLPGNPCAVQLDADPRLDLGVVTLQLEPQLTAGKKQLCAGGSPEQRQRVAPPMAAQGADLRQDGKRADLQCGHLRYIPL